MDIVGPLTQKCEGNKYLLTFQDELSKYTLAVPIPQQDASTVARFFVEQILRLVKKRVRIIMIEI